MDWNSTIDAASARISTHIVRTPVANLDFGLECGPVEVKLEHMQHTGSFKARGAFNTLLSTDVPAAGIVAASGGNHGAAAAFAAHKLGHKARIFVPELAGPSKIALIERTGADLTVVPGEYANAMAAAHAYETDTGAAQIHAYDAHTTVAGQGTLMAEWEDQGLQADTVIIAVGGGGLIAGALGWLGTKRKVIAVEPEQAPTLNTALKNNAPTDVEVSGIAANALGARRIGDICFDLAQTNNVSSVLVTDQAIADAQNKIWCSARQLVEPAGATALAALTSGAYCPERDERIAVLLCGANVAPDPIAKMHDTLF